MEERPNAAEARGPTGQTATRRFWVGFARAVGGAIFFSLPLLMTMEMWWLGFYIDRLKLVLLVILTFPVLVGLATFAGFKETLSWIGDVVDAFVALGVGFASAALVLVILNIVTPDMDFREWLGKITLLAVPASFGAMLATSQLGGRGKEQERRKRHTPYLGEVFFMAAGAVFFAANVAPTEEMIVIAFKMTYWHALTLGAATLVMMHAFVYGVEFHGTPEAPGASAWHLFLRFTVVGYAIALLISAYVLWTFDRFEGQAFAESMRMVMVLGFPAGLGASVARLIL